MPSLIIKNAAVVLSDRVVDGAAVIVEDGKLVSVCPSSDVNGSGGGSVVDAGGAYLAPGFIDMHIHGTGGFRVDEGAAEFLGLCRVLPKFGVTGFLPTVSPRPAGEDAEFLKLLSAVHSDGCGVLGYHLEGPFLACTGSFAAEDMDPPSADRIKALIAAAKPHGIVFSIAPDVEGILDVIPLMLEAGMPVFITHTRADVKQSQAAIEAGARHATHFYDVFHMPDETDPGVRPCGAVEAILADPRATVDFILDGEHVDPVAVQMALQCKGPDKVCLITDANIGAGLPAGRYKYGENEYDFAYDGAPARRAPGGPRKAGVLCGSGLTLDRAVRNAISMLGVELPQAVKMASTNPARVIGLAEKKGKIQEGFDADLILLDKDLNVTRTWINGQCVYDRDN